MVEMLRKKERLDETSLEAARVVFFDPSEEVIDLEFARGTDFFLKVFFD